MATSSQPARRGGGRRDTNFIAEIGVAGRKTGFTVKDTGTRDAAGMEDINAFFSPSPQKLAAPRPGPNGNGHPIAESPSNGLVSELGVQTGMHTATEGTMDIATSSGIEPTEALTLRANKTRQFSLPPRSRTPSKISGSPRRGSSIGPRSSPTRQMQPTPSKRLEFGLSRENSQTIFGSPHTRLLSSPRRPIGKAKVVAAAATQPAKELAQEPTRSPPKQKKQLRVEKIVEEEETQSPGSSPPSQEQKKPKRSLLSTKKTFGPVDDESDNEPQNTPGPNADTNMGDRDAIEEEVSRLLDDSMVPAGDMVLDVDVANKVDGHAYMLDASKRGSESIPPKKKSDKDSKTRKAFRLEPESEEEEEEDPEPIRIKKGNVKKTQTKKTTKAVADAREESEDEEDPEPTTKRRGAKQAQTGKQARTEKPLKSTKQTTKKSQIAPPKQTPDPEEEPEPTPKGRRKGSQLKAATKGPEVEPKEVAGKKTVVKPATAKKATRGAAVYDWPTDMDMSEAQTDQAEEGTKPAKPRRGAAKRAQPLKTSRTILKKVAEATSKDDEPEEEEEELEVPKKRGRKQAPPKAKRTNGKVNVQPEPELEDEVHEEESPPKKKARQAKAPAKAPGRKTIVPTRAPPEKPKGGKVVLPEDSNSEEESMPPPSRETKTATTGVKKAPPTRSVRSNSGGVAGGGKRIIHELPPPSREGSIIDDNGQRRSGRHRIPPLQYWKNEKVTYRLNYGVVDGVRRKSAIAMPEMVGIIRVESDPESSKAAKKTRKRAPASAGTKRKRTDVADAVDMDSDAEGDPGERETWETTATSQSGEIGVKKGIVKTYPPTVDSDGEDELEEVDLAYSRYRLVPVEIANANFTFVKTYGEPHFGTGIIEIPPGQMKRPKNSGKMNLVFYMLSGRATVRVADSAFRVGKGSQFMVPRGNVYSIENEFDVDTRMFFAQACEPTVNEGEGEED